MHHHARQSDDKSEEPLTFKTGKTALKGESDNFPVTVSPVRFHGYVFVVELGKQKEKHVLRKFSKVRLNTGKLGCISPKSRKQWRQDQDGGKAGKWLYLRIYHLNNGKIWIFNEECDTVDV